MKDRYGDAMTAPSLSVCLEPFTGRTVNFTLEVRSLAGPEHARLLALGEKELNRIAASDGERAHLEIGAATSAGDGFPMAVACAQVRNTSHTGKNKLWWNKRRSAGR